MPKNTVLRAPKGKFRVVGVDTVNGDDWIRGDFTTLKKAMAAAKEVDGKRIKMYVYDKNGKLRGEAGIDWY